MAPARYTVLLRHGGLHATVVAVAPSSTTAGGTTPAAVFVADGELGVAASLPPPQALRPAAPNPASNTPSSSFFMTSSISIVLAMA